MDLLPVLAVVGALGLYGAGVAGLHRRGRRWPVAATGCFTAGALALAVALSPPVLRRDDVDVPVHVVQHLLLMMVGPGLLCLGRPLVLAVQASPASLRPRLRAVLRGRRWRWPGGVPVSVAYYLAMALGFWAPVYRLQADQPLLHAAGHGCLVALGLCFWESVVGPGHRRARRPRVVWASLSLLAGMPVEAALGFLLADTERALPGATLAGTHTGGQVFWMASMAVTGAALALVLWRWATAEERVAAAALRAPAAWPPPAPGAAG